MKTHTVPNQVATTRRSLTVGSLQTEGIAIVYRNGTALAIYPARWNSQLPNLGEVQHDAHWRAPRRSGVEG